MQIQHALEKETNTLLCNFNDNIWRLTVWCELGICLHKALNFIELSPLLITYWTHSVHLVSTYKDNLLPPTECHIRANQVDRETPTPSAPC
jgi:hypothetical protein